MGATVLNGARIGANCLVGANALVTEGKTFPDGSLIVGAPARAVRTLDAAGFERLRRTAQGYVQKWRRYAGGLRQARLIGGPGQRFAVAAGEATPLSETQAMPSWPSRLTNT